jgi:uncharacterized membrane protein YhaH (DUF805 family)
VLRLKCSYCGATLTVEQHGNNLTVELADRVLGAIAQGKVQSQAEFQRLRLTQELSSAEMQLANVQSEMRAIQRGPINAVSRRQLDELNEKADDLQSQIANLQAQLYPNSPSLVGAPTRLEAWRITPQRIGWLLFSTNGRASRLEFWAGAVVFAAIYVALVIIFAIQRLLPDGGIGPAIATLLSLVSLVQVIALIWVGVAVGIKRFHDRDKPGWWVFLGFIPLVGLVWFIIELGLLPGSPGVNRYG